MQECFRRHPEHYGSEFDDSDSQEDLGNPTNPQVDEPSTSPVLDALSPNPEVDEPSAPLYQSIPSSTSPQVDEPSATQATSVSEGSQTTPDLSRKAPEDTKGQDRGLRTHEPYQTESSKKLVSEANHDSANPS